MCVFELGSLNLLMNELRKRDVRTKVQQLKSGRTIGGIPFTRGPLSYLLRNRFFVGEVVYKGEVLPGPQPPILDRALFDAVVLDLQVAILLAHGQWRRACERRSRQWDSFSLEFATEHSVPRALVSPLQYQWPSTKLMQEAIITSLVQAWVRTESGQGTQALLLRDRGLELTTSP